MPEGSVYKKVFKYFGLETYIEWTLLYTACIQTIFTYTYVNAKSK